MDGEFSTLYLQWALHQGFLIDLLEKLFHQNINQIFEWVGPLWLGVVAKCAFKLLFTFNSFVVTNRTVQT